jgi:hypothetical protein
LIACLLVASALAGCGGGGSSSDPPSGSEGIAEFVQADSPNKLLGFGAEAAAGERDAANAVLQANFAARAAANFAAQCSTLSAGAKEAVSLVVHVGPSGEVPKGCAKKLEKIAKPLAKSKEVREDRLSGPIPVLRVKGSEGFAIYRGTEGNDWVIPLEKEAGEWKVGSIQEEELKPEPPKKPTQKQSPKKKAE